VLEPLSRFKEISQNVRFLESNERVAMLKKMEKLRKENEKLKQRQKSSGEIPF
jgi:hypothetical protein